MDYSFCILPHYFNVENRCLSLSDLIKGTTFCLRMPYKVLSEAKT